MKDLKEYPYEIQRLTKEDGGGYLISFTDFNECIAGGETVEEAIAEGCEALAAVITTLEEKGLDAPEPGSYGAYSGKYVQRLPKSVYARLQAAARCEGVSVNPLAITYIVDGLARKTG